MRRSNRLQPVIKIADTREQKAARDLGESQRLLNDQQQQLDYLRNYRAEYGQQMQNRGRGGIAAQQIQQMQIFLAQIDKAIAQQQQRVEICARNCLQKRDHWLKARGRTQALLKVKEHYLDQERYAADKREQKEIDDLSQRKGGEPKL